MGFLWAGTGKALPYTMHSGDESVKVQGRCVLSFDDSNAYLAAGLGVLWLPDFMSKARAARGELVPLFEGWRLDPMPMYIAFTLNRNVSTNLRVFIKRV